VQRFFVASNLKKISRHDADPITFYHISLSPPLTFFHGPASPVFPNLVKETFSK
jgi:hypothetical protein